MNVGLTQCGCKIEDSPHVLSFYKTAFHMITPKRGDTAVSTPDMCRENVPNVQYRRRNVVLPSTKRGVVAQDKEPNKPSSVNFDLARSFSKCRNDNWPWWPTCRVGRDLEEAEWFPEIVIFYCRRVCFHVGAARGRVGVLVDRRHFLAGSFQTWKCTYTLAVTGT